MPRTKKTAVEPIAEAVSETPEAVTEAAVVAAEETKPEPKKTTRKKAVKAEEKAEAAPAPKRCCTRKKPAEEAAPVEAEKEAATKDEEQVSIRFQFGGKDFSTEEILERAKAAYLAAHEGAEIQTVDLYVNADDHAAYYVVNGQVPENNKIDL